MSHYSPYPAYKESGIEWIGPVPKHWISHKLKYIARFSGGGTPSRDNLTFWEGDIPWVSPKDMKFENISRTEESISEEGLNNSTTNLVDPGKILLVVRSGILKHTIPVAINDIGVALNQDMKALQLNSQLCDSRFFLRWVQGFNDSLLSIWLKQGATVESIEQEFLGESVLLLPSPQEQKQIITHLDSELTRIDALVSKKSLFIDLLREKRQALIKKFITKGISHNTRVKSPNPKLLGSIPKHWQVTSVKRVIHSIEQGWSPECESRPSENNEWAVLKVGCVNGGSFRASENKALPPHLEPRPELSLKKGDILVSRANTRELVGGCVVISRDFPLLMLCDKLYRLKTNNKIISEYLAAIIAILGPEFIE